jgi:geranylgeranyl diphosphate synthase type II
MSRVKSSVDDIILNQLLPSSSPIKEVDLLYKMMRDYPERPAKGLRPFICVTSCKAFGGKEKEALLTAACIELFQNWILIHDDIEDASEMRRGQPVLHRKYDESLALNTGDALHARMWGYLLRNKDTLGTDRTYKILEEFSTMVNETTEGQHMELVWVVGRRWDLEEKDYLDMVTRKTAWYTVTSPSRLGAIIARTPESEMEKLLEFGWKLGVGFQIQDDSLNLIGDEKKFGKKSSDDILEGKRTLMLLRLLRLSTPNERERLIRIMNKTRKRKTSKDVEYVLSLMRRYKTIEYARQRASRFVDEAIAVMKTLTWKGDAQSVELFHQAARFLVDRQW